MKVIKRVVSIGAGHREGEYTEIVESQEVRKPMPRQQLLSVVGLLRAVAGASEGQVTVPELADALTRVYDPDEMMIYDASVIGLAWPIGDALLGTVGGYNKRSDVMCDIFNSGFWDERRSAVVNGGSVDAICVSKPDAVELARSLWAFFFPRGGDCPEIEHLLPIKTTDTKPQAGVPDYLNPQHPRYSQKLAAAVRAWEAADQLPAGKTPKQVADRWLRANAGAYGLINDDGNPNNSAIEEIAKIVNWKPGGGAPTTPGA